MLELLKGAMTGFDHGITEWDAPSKRVREDGTVVYGRPTRGFGNGGTFSYAGKDYTPEPWTDEILHIKDHAEAILAVKYGLVGPEAEFSFCLAGLYPTGTDGIPFHSDTVPSENDIVFSISLGAPRIFTNRVYPTNIKEVSNTSTPMNKIELENFDRNGMYKDTMFLMEDGDAIIFDGASQMNSMHAVPGVEGVGERINLTFRTGL